jgi:ABC-type Na+ efflux pump permease subunit
VRRCAGSGKLSVVTGSGIGNERERRRRWSTVLSALAAIITVAIFGASFLFWNHDDSVRIWLAWIAVPPVCLSAAATVQYARGEHSGAGAAAAAVYWVLIVLTVMRALEGLFLGAVLQTAAWFISRPGRDATAVPRRNARTETAP